MGKLAFGFPEKPAFSFPQKDLARGLGVSLDGRDLIEGGMGFGCPALRLGDRTFFSSSRGARNGNPETTFRKDFPLDCQWTWASRGKPCPAANRFFHACSDFYMDHPKVQSLLLPLAHLPDLVPWIRKETAPIAPVALFHSDYALSGNRVEISWTIESLECFLPRVFVLNELGGRAFSQGWENSRRIPSPSGWVPLPLEGPWPAFFSPGFNLLFALEEFSVQAPAKVFLRWGREMGARLSWSGFELEADCSGETLERISGFLAFSLTERQKGGSRP
jgi:hypothetical protein